MKLYNGFTEEKWQRIKTDPYFEKTVSAIIKRADGYLNTPPAEIKYTDLHLFVLTGDRSQYETAYTNLRSRVSMFHLAYMLTEREEYLEALSNAIWTLCNLESWALPAHVSENEDMMVRRSWLELVSCNVGRMLGEVYATVGDKLPELVRRRIEFEVRERIFKGYESRSYGWSEGASNWSAVCIVGVLGAYLYIATPEEIEAQIPNMCKSADAYLRGFDDEGCCKEGYGYWHYGFIHFCMFAEMLKNYTNGKIDYFAIPKVHAIAKFQENMAINDKECIRFSDCSGQFAPDPSISHFLKGIYSDVQIPSIPAPTASISELTYLIWINPDLKDSTMCPKSMIYHESQWFIYRSEGYNFVCKAGSNDEPHNHNDVGSFMISKGGRVTFTDPGTGKYTRQYFNPAERYFNLEPSARSHSLPIIDGQLQIKKSGKSKIYKEGEREYAFSMENGYDIPNLKSLTRHFVCEDDGVVLTDSFVFENEPKSIVERFISLIEPVIEDGRVTVGDSVLTYDTAIFDIKLSSEISVRKNDTREPVYMVDLVAKELKKNVTFTFKFT